MKTITEVVLEVVKDPTFSDHQNTFIIECMRRYAEEYAKKVLDKITKDFPDHSYFKNIKLPEHI